MNRKPGRTSGRLCRLLSGLLAAATTTTALANGGPEGIAVHGDWEVLVVDPDGTVVQEHRFRNDLTGDGAAFLVGLLTGAAAIYEGPPRNEPAWGIQFSGSGFDDNPSTQCDYLTSIGAPPSYFVGPGNASVSLEFPGDPRSNSAFTLSTTIALPAECLDDPGGQYSIDRVLTYADVVAEFSPSVDAYLFSQKSLDTPVTGIFAEQQVILRVTYSFE